MKKYRNRVCIMVLAFLLVFPILGHANEVSLETTLTLGEIRSLAREQTNKTEPYKEAIKQIEIEKEKIAHPFLNVKNYSYDIMGRETITYVAGGKPYDFDEKIKGYEEKIENLKDENELKAISKFQEIINKSYEIKDKERAVELAENDFRIAELSLKVGTIYPLQLENARVQFSILKSELEVLINDMNKLFEEMNKIIGFESNARYEFNLDNIMRQVNLGTDSIYVPEDAVEFVIKNSKEIQDLKENVEEIEKTLGRLEVFIPQTSYIYEKRVEDLGLEDILTDIEEIKRIEKLNLKREYIGVYISLIGLDKNYNDLLQGQKDLSIERVKLDSGILSKSDFEKSLANYEGLEQNHMNQIIAVYRVILDYEMKQE